MRRALLAAALLAAPALAVLAAAGGSAVARAEAAPACRRRSACKTWSSRRRARLLDQPRSAAGLARRALAHLRGPLARGLRRDALDAMRGVAAALSAAERAARARDEIGLAAARGGLRAALVHGSYTVTLAAVRAGDARRAGAWLLLREFRTATRFTRPGVDATLAVREPRARAHRSAYGAAGGRERPARRLPGPPRRPPGGCRRRRGARLPGALGADGGARRRPLGDPGAGVRGRPRRRGAPAGRRRLRPAERAARRGQRAAFAAARRDVTRALEGFTAAPFTEAEQARRAAQLIRFLDLVPIEYRDGTDDGRVTIPFEIQEAIAFREGAASAFSDLEAELRSATRARWPRWSARERLRVYVEDAGERKRVVPEGQVEEAHERASDALAELIPDEWTEDDSQSDFDLIALTLDRMESAVNAGEYTQAEQARLEAYAFFEFGPELSLRSIAPHVVAEVEGLVWFGAEGKDGLAS